MKRFTLLSFLVLFATVSFAQGTAISLNITVVDANNNPVPNHPLTMVDSSFMGSWYSLTTNASGVVNSVITIPTPPLGTTKQLYLITSDNCNNVYSTDTVLTANTIQFSWTHNFVICAQGSVGNCNFNVTAQSNALGTVFSSTYVGGPNSVFSWSFGDGTSAVGQTVTHAYAQPGSYMYCLSVDSCQVCDTVVAGNTAPCDASFGYANNGLTVELFPAAAGGAGMIYIDWGDGTSSGFSASPVLPILHTYGTPFTYTVCLIYVDSACADTSCQPVSVGQITCNAAFTASSTGLYTQINPVSIGSPGTFIFSWGDGAFDTVASSALPIIPYNHTYLNGGTYIICVEHFSSNTCYDSACAPVTVTQTPLQCNASFIIDTINSQPGTVYAWNMSNVNGGSAATIINFIWDFGDGTTSTQPFPTHNYQNPGSYAICLTMTAVDSSLITCISTFCDSLTVDQNGNIIYKGAIVGWNFVVLDPNSIGLEENVLAEAKIYPNPARDLLTIELPEDAVNIESQVYSISGSLVSAQPLQAGVNSLDVANLPPGVYVLHLISEVATTQIRFVKQ